MEATEYKDTFNGICTGILPRSSLPDDVAFPLHGETARDDAAVPIVPDPHRLVQSRTGQTAVRPVQGHAVGASGGNDVVPVHQIHVDVAGDDARAVPVAGEGVLDFRAPGILAAEEAVQLHVILLAVDDDAVRLVVAEHQLAHVRAMPEAAVEHTRQHAALAAVVAVVSLHAAHVHLRNRVSYLCKELSLLPIDSRGLILIKMGLRHVERT